MLKLSNTVDTGRGCGTFGLLGRNLNKTLSLLLEREWLREKARVRIPAGGPASMSRKLISQPDRDYRL